MWINCCESQSLANLFLATISFCKLDRRRGCRQRRTGTLWRTSAGTRPPTHQIGMKLHPLPKTLLFQKIQNRRVPAKRKIQSWRKYLQRMQWWMAVQVCVALRVGRERILQSVRRHLLLLQLRMMMKCNCIHCWLLCLKKNCSATLLFKRSKEHTLAWNLSRHINNQTKRKTREYVHTNTHGHLYFLSMSPTSSDTLVTPLVGGPTSPPVHYTANSVAAQRSCIQIQIGS